MPLWHRFFLLDQALASFSRDPWNLQEHQVSMFLGLSLMLVRTCSLACWISWWIRTSGIHLAYRRWRIWSIFDLLNFYLGREDTGCTVRIGYNLCSICPFFQNNDRLSEEPQESGTTVWKCTPCKGAMSVCLPQGLSTLARTEVCHLDFSISVY